GARLDFRRGPGLRLSPGDPPGRDSRRKLSRAGHKIGRARNVRAWRHRGRCDGGLSRECPPSREQRPLHIDICVRGGTPVPADTRVEVLGRLPESESILLLARRDHAFSAFADFRDVSIGIGPEGSGTAYLMLQLLKEPDLADLGVRWSHHDLTEQIELVAHGQLDLAAVVMSADAEFVRRAMRQYDLDIAAPKEIEGLIRRHRWLGLGRIPVGLYDGTLPTPPVDKTVADVDTLVVANACSGRAERMAFLTLLGAELPGFIRSNPPRSVGSASSLPLAPEARQFFVSGEPEIADKYFPWLVDLMSPAYWVYLFMTVTILFNAMRGVSRFQLWRIDAAREKLEARLAQLTGAELGREKIRAAGVKDP